MRKLNLVLPAIIIFAAAFSLNVKPVSAQTAGDIPQTAHIIVLKDAIPNSAQDFAFTDNFGNGNPDNFLLDDDSNATLPKSRDFEVLAGTGYSVSESSVAGWKQSSAICDGAGNTPANITVAAGETVTCIFTNRKLGQIVIIKNTTGGDSSFDLEMTGATLPAGATLTTTAGTATETFLGIDPENTYSISEKDPLPDGWSQTGVSCKNENNIVKNAASFQINNGGTVTCTFLNTYTPPAPTTGRLKVQKTTEPAGEPAEFPINISGTGNVISSVSGVISDPLDHEFEVMPGLYSVTEDLANLPGWSQLDNTCVNVAVAAGENATCAITNKYTPPAPATGTLTIVKTTEDGDAVFSFDITGEGTLAQLQITTVAGTGASETFTLPAGIYAVAETPLAGWTQDSAGCDDGRSTATAGSVSGVSLGSGQNVTCTFNNHKNPPPTGTLSVKKIVDNSGGGSKTAGNFAFFINAGPAIAFEADAQNDLALPEGIYTVTEASAAGYTAEYDNCADLDITSGTAVTCVITNRYQPPILGNSSISGFVYEDWDGDASDFEKRWERPLAGWQVFLDTNGNGALDSGEAVVVTDRRGAYRFENLTSGAYQVRELLKPGWSQTFPGSVKYDVTISNEQNLGNINFGNFKLGEISGAVFEDKNGDGRKNLGENGLAGWTVKLKKLNGSMITALTDNEGKFAFAGLDSGKYILTEASQRDWRQTTRNFYFFTVTSRSEFLNSNFGDRKKH
jgi:hypothetical protein